MPRKGRIHVKLKSALLGVAFVMSAACTAQDTPAPASAPEPNHLYWFAAAEDEAPRPWAVILPGGGGIDNFGDEGAYYFAFAQRLNDRGIDALVVHYQKDIPPREELGLPAYAAEIARAAIRGVEYERSLGRMDLRCDGLIFAWSMGGQGMWDLASGSGVELPGLAEAIAFYPSTQERGEGYDPKVPVTLLQGDADTLTPLPALEEFIAGSTAPDAFTLHVFEGARHGFDLYTVPEPQLGGGFSYDQQSAEAAQAILDRKLAGADLGCGLD
jgi:dienelactone hydrolase